MERAEPHQHEGPADRDLTVARIRTRDGADHVEVLFLESARIYRLPNDCPGFDQLLRSLRDAEASRQPVRVALASPYSEIIRDVVASS
ncbi:MAG TPA: hypothetical protein VM242_14650 [Acidimicrobiales bacterium]|jgi:hypothetical protein|nr:hypothetical protein [Acidimicrobiales bacterium]